MTDRRLALKVKSKTFLSPGDFENRWHLMYEARKIFQRETRRKNIIPAQKCEACGAEAGKTKENGRKTMIVGHHPNYSRPLEVIWLCKSCHKRAHRRKGEINV